jgi:predicted alpha/beta-fold hydrolase
MSTEPKRGDNSTSTKIGELATREFLSRVKHSFDRKPFQAHRLFGGGHAQTLAAYAWPYRYRFNPTVDEERLFEVDPQTRVLAHCRWHSEPSQHPTMVMWHGMEGSTASGYMPSTAEKAFAAGFNVVRVNLRNCGGTEHLTPTLYHAGLSEDFRAVLNELIERDGLTRIFAVGFSLSGNIVLKLAGEYGDNPPSQLLGICAISPSVDHYASVAAIMLRSNRLYHRDFLRRMRNRVRRKQKLFPHLFDLGQIDQVRTLRDFDETFTSRAHGFAGADDYYQKTSSLKVIDRIRVPTLIIHAEDDPFIPFAPLRHPAIARNPYLLVMATSKGGHVAFVSRDSEDRFWAENRLVEFCAAANETF